MARIKHTSFRPKPLICSPRRAKPSLEEKIDRSYLELEKHRKQLNAVIQEKADISAEMQTLGHVLVMNIAPCMPSPRDSVLELKYTKQRLQERGELISIKMELIMDKLTSIEK